MKPASALPCKCGKGPGNELNRVSNNWVWVRKRCAVCGEEGEWKGSEAEAILNWNEKRSKA